MLLTFLYLLMKKLLVLQLVSIIQFKTSDSPFNQSSPLTSLTTITTESAGTNLKLCSSPSAFSLSFPIYLYGFTITNIRIQCYRKKIIMVRTQMRLFYLQIKVNLCKIVGYRFKMVKVLNLLNDLYLIKSYLLSIFNNYKN